MAEKIILGILRAELILAPVVFAWATYELVQAEKSRRELEETAAWAEMELSKFNL